MVPKMVLTNFENICFEPEKDVGAPLSSQHLISFFKALICMIFAYKLSTKQIPALIYT